MATDTYTNPTGLTPQAIQQASGAAVSGNYSAMPSTAQLGDAYTQSAGQLAQMQSPEARETAIQASQLPAMQANYEDMARKLYEYDKMYMSPEYANSPSQASDALSFGRVGPSQLQQLTPQAAAGPTSLFADNPKYAVAAQAAQQGSILNMLNSLSGSISKELGATRGKYGSTVKSQQTLLDTIASLLNLKISQEEREKDRAEARAARASSRGEAKDSEFYAVAADSRNRIDAGTDPWGTVWEEMRARFPDKSAEEIDMALGGKWDAAAGKGSGRAESGYYEKQMRRDLGIKEEYQNGGVKQSFQDQLNAMTPQLQQLERDWADSSLLDRLNPASKKGITLYNQRDILGQQIARLIENGRLSNTDREFYLSKLPQWWMNKEQASAAIDGFEKAIQANWKGDGSGPAVTNGGGDGGNDPLGIR